MSWFQEAAKKADTSTAHFLAIGSRETNLLNIRGDKRGGIYHGYGVMQVDIGTDPDYARTGRQQMSSPAFVEAARFTLRKMDQVIAGQGKRLSVKKQQVHRKGCGAG